MNKKKKKKNMKNIKKKKKKKKTLCHKGFCFWRIFRYLATKKNWKVFRFLGVNSEKMVIFFFK